MIDIFATTLAVIMIPAIPLNTAVELKQNVVEEDTQIVQTLESDISAYANERQITIMTPNQSNAQAYVVTQDYSDEVLDYFTRYFEYNTHLNLNPKIIDGATATYNSTAYSFYMSWVNGAVNCKLYNFGPFLDDMSFVEVKTPQINDIIVYYAFNEKTSIYEPIHSGIVKNVSNETPNGICESANTVTVISKWSVLGLYEHQGDECPYISKYNFTDDFFNFDISATKVKYYRRHAYHNYNEFEITETTHTYKCACGLKGKTEEHTHNAGYTKFNNSTYHYSNCKCGHQIEEVHIWQPYYDNLLTLGIDPEYGVNPLIVPRNKLRCKYCYFIKILKDDEIIVIPWH